jgi:methyl-accepting chemotaxis protein
MVDLQQGAIERQTRGVRDTQALLGQLNVASHQISSQIKGSRDRLEVLDRHVAFLWEQLSEIHQIASVVQELAHQTNLLALNAGVEALRTGSPTGGFDLVALKMRALAYESQQCANQISPLVRGMETANGEVSPVDRGVQDFDTLKQAFEDIDGAIAQVETHSHQEAMTVQQLLVSIEQLESDIAQIASISQESHLSLKELDEARDDLKKLL